MAAAPWCSGDAMLNDAGPPRRPAAGTTVAVRNLRVEALIGVNPDERERRQPLIVTVEALLDVRPSLIAETIDYRAIAAEAHDVASRHVGLIEEYARLLGERCLALGPVEQVAVTVAKPEALAQGMAMTTVCVARPAPANILPFPRSRRSGRRHEVVRFAFDDDINPEAQRTLAGFLRHFARSLHGVELGSLSFDTAAGEWVARITLDGTRAPRVEPDGPSAAIEGRLPLQEVT